MKLLPFDLAKAQARHTWGTRDGRKGKKIFDTEREGSERLIVIFEDDSENKYTIDGYLYEGGMLDKGENLFLYEEEKIGWVVIRKDERIPFGFQTMRFITEKDKSNYEKIYKADGTYIDTVEVRY